MNGEESVFTAWYNNLFPGVTDYKVVVIGLDNAGKTTLLYKLVLNRYVETIPTVGFNVESITHNNVKLTFFDAAWSSNNIKKYVHHYFPATRGVIMVVDSTDIDRLRSDNLRKLLLEGSSQQQRRS